MKPIPFRQMRPTLHQVQANVQLLLGLPAIAWTEQDYATFLVMGDMSKAMINPTRLQMLTQIGAWLRFYKRLLDRLPEGAGRTTLITEFERLSEPYHSLLEAQPS